VKQTKLQWLHNPSEINGDKLNNVRCEASRFFRNRKREYLKDKINEFSTNSKDKNIRDLYREIHKSSSPVPILSQTNPVHITPIPPLQDPS
jgi:hypothetical protein